MLKRFISLLCIFTLLMSSAVSLISCSGEKLNGGGTTAEETTDTSAAETDILSHIPDVKYDNYDFRILIRDGESYTREAFAENENGERINDAVYKRNLRLKEKYDVNIVLKPVVNPANEEELGEIFRTSVLAQDNAYDMALIHTVNAGKLAAEGIFYNWKDIPVISFDKPWWNKELIDSLTIGDSLYLATNSFSLHAMEYSWGMVYNKTLAEKFNTDDFYNLVRNGKWALDKVGEITKAISDDIDGNQVMNEEDLYGLGINWWGGTIALMYGADQTVTKRGTDGYPYIDLNTPKTVTLTEKIFDLMYSNNSCLGPDYMPNIYAAFQDDRILLCAIVLNEIPGLRNMNSDFGILPLPKYDESQEKYKTMVDGHASIMVIPTYIQDTERFGVITEALAAMSYEVVVPEYYETTLQTKFTRDGDSAEMLDMIIGGRTYDFGYIYDIEGLGFIMYTLMSQKSKNFASEYARREAAAQNTLTVLVEAFQSFSK